MAISQEHLDALGRLVVKHPVFADVEAALLEHLELAEKDSILVIVGPSGVGKTTLIEYVRQILEPYCDRDGGSRYLSPPVVASAPVAKGIPFPWKVMYRELLDAMGEVGSTDKVSLDSRQADSGRRSTRSLHNRSVSVDELGGVVESALNDRKPPAVVIDECQHIGASPTGRVKASNLDVIKQHRANVDVPIILVGTYEAEDMLRYSGQISRRVELVRFEPYYPDKSGVKVFQDIVAHIVEKAEIPIAFNIDRHAWDLHWGACGCVGILSSWLYRAAYRAHKAGSPTLTLDQLWAARSNTDDIRAIAAEISRHDGERWGAYGLTGKGPGNGQSAPSGSNGERKKSKSRPGIPHPRRHEKDTSPNRG